MELANLEYKFFFQERIDFLPNYRDFRLENTNSYEAKITLIKRNLERSIKFVFNNENLKRKKFEYYNILGDLHHNLFLIIKEPMDYDSELLKTILKELLDYYLKAEQFSKDKGKYFNYIEYLPIFTNFLEEIEVHNNLDVKTKAKRVKVYFNDYLSNTQ